MPDWEALPSWRAQCLHAVGNIEVQVGREWTTGGQNSEENKPPDWRRPGMDGVGEAGKISEEETFPRRHEEWRKGGSLEKNLLGRGAGRSEEESSRLVLGSRKRAAVSEQGGQEECVG